METNKETSSTIPEFTNSKNEKLGLRAIINKRITSVTISYVTKKNNWLIRFWNQIRSVSNAQTLKEVTINEQITFYYAAEVSHATILFSSKTEFDKVIDFDEDFIWKKHTDRRFIPYQVNFYINNLVRIDWE